MVRAWMQQEHRIPERMSKVETPIWYIILLLGTFLDGVRDVSTKYVEPPAPKHVHCITI